MKLHVYRAAATTLMTAAAAGRDIVQDDRINFSLQEKKNCR